MKLCEHYSSGENIAKPVGRCMEREESIDNFMLEIEIVQSRMASMQSLIDSLAALASTTVSNLSREVSRLQIDLEEEKFKNKFLEIGVNSLKS